MLGRLPFLTLLRVLLACVYRIGFCVMRLLRFRAKTPLQKSQVVIVGSFLAGGAGKTPLVQQMAKIFLEQNKSVVILCHRAAWDEFRMLQSTTRGVSVLSTADRFRMAQKIDGKWDVILCDGGLEDSRFVNANVFVLRWNETANSLTDLIPAGPCVSLEKDHPDALPIKCFRSSIESGRLAVAYSIESIQNFRGESLTFNSPVAIVTGIGMPERFTKDVLEFGLSVKRKIFLRDHSKGYGKVLRKELKKSLPIVLTEKDFARLDSSEKENPFLYVAKERVQMNSALESYLNELAGGAARNPPSTL